MQLAYVYEERNVADFQLKQWLMDAVVAQQQAIMQAGYSLPRVYNITSKDKDGGKDKEKETGPKATASAKGQHAPSHPMITPNIL